MDTSVQALPWFPSIVDLHPPEFWLTEPILISSLIVLGKITFNCSTSIPALTPGSPRALSHHPCHLPCPFYFSPFLCLVPKQASLPSFIATTRSHLSQANLLFPFLSPPFPTPTNEWANINLHLKSNHFVILLRAPKLYNWVGCLAPDSSNLVSHISKQEIQGFAKGSWEVYSKTPLMRD